MTHASSDSPHRKVGRRTAVKGPMAGLSLLCTKVREVRCDFQAVPTPGLRPNIEFAGAFQKHVCAVSALAETFREMRADYVGCIYVGCVYVSETCIRACLDGTRTCIELPRYT